MHPILKWGVFLSAGFSAFVAISTITAYVYGSQQLSKIERDLLDVSILAQKAPIIRAEAESLAMVPAFAGVDRLPNDLRRDAGTLLNRKLPWSAHYHADGGVVPQDMIDEAHSFDPAWWSALVGFDRLPARSSSA